MGKNGNIVILTGPNMAGRTVFLKTIGVNIVLALAGGPVCSKNFTISPLNLVTSIKARDSLEKKIPYSMQNCYG